MRNGVAATLGLAVPTILLLCPTQAAAIPIPIIWGQGDTVSHVSDLPAEIRAQLREQTKKDLAVGFKYSYFSLLFCNFWTWNGKFVVYHDNMYFDVPEAQISQWLGKSEGDLNKPFAYRFPLGLLILGGIVALVLLKKILVKSDADRVRKLLKNPKYQHALEILTRPEPQPAADRLPPDASQVFESRFTAAVDYLYGEGLSREEAETNLRLIVRTIQSA